MLRLNRFLIAPLCAAGSLWLLAGCGGSGSGDKLLVSPASSPTDTPCSSSVEAAPLALSGGANGAGGPSGIQVTWTPLCDVSRNNVLEYHILRDRALVGVATRDTNTFADIGRLGAPPLTFQTITASAPPVYGLRPQIVPVPDFTFGLHVYMST